ncbi:universal stress protein [Mycolicibacterium aubagnense]|uniref:Universal stress protein n=1 Tax=Mycolicibacterium aubagnense TaxID=319707 RepID=A0ABM7I8G9_9MYCO|nr:universal stress protein [Mycolicibacterium aubagnense]TLH69532.1 universal stress protein [Mycolicibacterium aubagnense]WGI35099.1 universal stress protein [Mycolicibacterium aubagnense]BBX82961.1 universal stress protein [Mycolicibacterium aubagnense]
MTNPRAGLPVVVGIDGSDAAIRAALWAIDEAMVRSVPLRLVAALSPAHLERSHGTADPSVAHADTALRAAADAVAATGKPVQIETVQKHTAPTTLLLDESRSAALLCVGSVGIDRIAARVLGSTAEAVASRAQCPVAIVRSHSGTSVHTERSSGRNGWVALSFNTSGDHDELAAVAFREAALRNTGVIAVLVPSSAQTTARDSLVDRIIADWSSRYPDVPVQSWMAARSLDEFIASSEVPIQLAVIGPPDAHHLQRLVGPANGLSHFTQTECSVIVVRH